MKDRLLQLAFSLILTIGVAVVLAHADPVPVPAHLERGLTLVDQIVASQQSGLFADTNGVLLNRYGGSWNSPTDPSFIRFLDAANGIRPGNNTTCAPLVTHLLKTAYNWDWSAFAIYDPLLNQTVATASPKAYRYVSAIKSNVGFTSAEKHCV